MPTTDLPTKRIKKIQLPLASGETAADKTYEIVPDKMQSSGFQAVLPTLATDDTIVTTKTSQTISGTKTFTSADGIIITDPTDGWETNISS